MSGTPSLELIFRLQQRAFAEIGTMRDDMGAMMAILQRIDGTLTRESDSMPPILPLMTRERARYRARLFREWAGTMDEEGDAAEAARAARLALYWLAYAEADNWGAE